MLSLLNFSPIDTLQIVATSSTEFVQEPWYHDPRVWIPAIFTALAFILAFIRFLIWLFTRGKREIGEQLEFPFEIIDPKDLTARLYELQLLTEIRNKYINRARGKIHTPEKIQKSRQRILIFGRASIGKTREALELITRGLLTGPDPGAVLILTKAAIPEDFSDKHIQAKLVNKAVVLFCDDLPNIFSSKSEMSTPQDRLQKIIECCEDKTNQFHFVATARHELCDKLGTFDYKNDPFWNTFQIYELSELEKKSEIEMIKDLTKLYDITIDDNAILCIQEINKGYSCEGIVTFLKNQAQAKISINEIKKRFKKEAFESWRTSTFEMLQRQEPEIEEIYKIFRFLRFQLNSIILKSIVLVLSENLLKKRMKGIFKAAKKKALKILEFLEKRMAISASKEVISLPDYQLEHFSDLDIEEQISILIRKVKKLSNREREAIANALLSFGLLAASEDDFGNALKKFGQILIFKPNTVVAYNNRGVIYARNLKKFNKGINEFNRAIKLNPQLPGVFNNRGNTYKMQGELNNAIADYNKAIELNPKYAMAFNNRGIVYKTKGELDKAIKDYNKAIELNPLLPVALYNRGLAYTDKGELDRAIKDYNKAIELNPLLPEAFYNRGNAYKTKSELDKAIEDYNKAIELKPQYVDAFNKRGIAFAAVGELGKAIADYNKAIELNPQYAEAMVNIGMVYEISKDKEKSKYWYKQALKYKDQLPDKGTQVLRRLKEFKEA